MWFKQSVRTFLENMNTSDFIWLQSESSRQPIDSKSCNSNRIAHVYESVELDTKKCQM